MTHLENSWVEDFPAEVTVCDARGMLAQPGPNAYFSPPGTLRGGTPALSSSPSRFRERYLIL